VFIAGKLTGCNQHGHLPTGNADFRRQERTSIALARACLDAGVVTGRYEDDCRHVAIATIDRVDVLLSWNCHHIVNYDKIRLFNGVNIIKGYGQLEIRTPAEVIEYDE
jgi:hypothetical protein